MIEVAGQSERRPGGGTRRVRVFVSGRVQGVCFRDATRTQARALGLEGWVRNLADGRVEAVFQGPSEAVAEAIAWCGRGPSLARVEHVDPSDETPADDIGGSFEVRPTS